MTARGSLVRKTPKHPRPPKQPRPPRFQRVPPLIIVTLQTFNSWIILSGGQKGVTGSENIHLCKATEILLYLGAGTILTITTRVSSQEKLSGKYLAWETSAVWFLHSFLFCTMPFYSTSILLIEWLSSLILLEQKLLSSKKCIPLSSTSRIHVWCRKRSGWKWRMWN